MRRTDLVVFTLFAVLSTPALAANVAVNLNTEEFWTSLAPWANAVSQFDPSNNYTFWRGYLPGDYAVSWSGTGAPAITGPKSTFTVTGPGKGVLHLAFDKTGPNGDVFSLSTNQVSNLQILSPDAAPGTPFRQPFLDKLNQLVHGSVIRYMDWMDTNASQITNWSDRNTSVYQTTKKGVSYENIVALSNATATSPWINIPARATDDYVRQLARLMKANLNPTLQVYVEYSNELWNGGMQDQYNYNLDLAKADPQFTRADPYGRAAQRAAERLRQINEIFKQEFGASSGRVVPEIGGQMANPYWGDTQIQWLQSKGVNLKADQYRLAIAPYVPGGEGEIGLKGNETKDQIFQKLNDYMNTTIRSWIHNARTSADSAGITLDSYEAAAGSFYSLNDPADKALQSTFYAMQDDPKMGQLYKDFVAMWNKESGGGLFNAYGLVGDNTQWGQWYLLHDINDTDSQKWDALLNYVTCLPPASGVVATATPGIPEPGTLSLVGVAGALVSLRRHRRAA